MNTVLHLPLNKELKAKAESLAKSKGYSSLQEVLRVFIVQFAQEKLKPTFINTDETISLTPAQEQYLSQREQEVEKAMQKGGAYSVNTADEMMKVLEK